MDFLAALRFLTVIPIPGARQPTAEEMGRSVAYFPLVGLGLGLGLWGLDGLLGLVFPPVLLNAVLVVALIAVTGALHLDGFMDTCDGLAAGRTAEQRLQIMRDSGLGSYGIAGGISLVLLKYAALSALPLAVRPAALVMMPALGRWAMVYALYAFPYARSTQGMGRTFAEQVAVLHLAAASLTMFVIAIIFLGMGGIAILTVALVASWALGNLLAGRLGGLTGDTYGAINEMVEVIALLAILVIHKGWAVI